jgi:general secretion pathway protein K
VGRDVRKVALVNLASAQRGVALIIVLWVVTLLTVIASSFLYAMRTDTRVVGNVMARAKAEAAAEAAIHRAVFDLYKPPTVTDRWIADGVPHEWPYGEVQVVVSMLDESGKIDINVVSDQLLRGLLISQGVVEEEAAVLVDAIADWRDPDSLKRLRGAEEAEYTAAGRKYKPANAPFQTIEELKLVLGITPELYQRLEPLITTFSRQPGVNPQIASRAVLRAIPGATEELIDAYILQRETARANKMPIPNFQPALPFQAFGGGYIVSVRAVASMADGTSFERVASVIRTANPKRPLAFLRWQEGDARNEATTPETALNPQNSTPVTGVVPVNAAPVTGTKG